MVMEIVHCLPAVVSPLPSGAPATAGLSWLGRPTRDALCLLVALAQEGPQSAIVISRQAKVPNTRFERMMRRLVAVGLVAARRGRAGGYRLGREASTISVLEIMMAAEGHIDDDLGLREVGRQLRVCLASWTLAEIVSARA